MGENSGIQWTTHTFNPWVGCQRVSPGCTNCYAEAYDKRVGGRPKSQRADPNVPELRWGPRAPRVRTSAANWRQPLKWNAAAKAAGQQHRVFCSSLADVFEDRRDLDAARADLLDLISRTASLDWLLLTKRPGNVMPLLRGIDNIDGATVRAVNFAQRWVGGAPPANVWLGTTVEDQQRANERVPELLSVPARVRFLSCEPLLEHVDVSRWLWPACWHWDAKFRTSEEAQAAGAYAEKRPQSLVAAGSSFIDWIIIGGESGPGARPFHLDWARSLMTQARAAGAAPFVKQLGARPRMLWDDAFECPRLLRFYDGDWDLGQLVEEGLVRFDDPAGGDMAEWPEDLRVREFPRIKDQ